MPLETFVERPLRVADALARGDCGGSYIEACLIISGVMSSIASFVWPGTRIDRARFVETWVRFGSPAHPMVTRISVPLLRHTLFNGQVADARAIERLRPDMFSPGNSCRVVSSDEVDTDEGEISSTLPHVEKRLLRQHAYPSVFYEHVRSQTVHEYSLEGAATAWPMTMKPNPRVSYSNTMRSLHGTNAAVSDVSTREIHFHFDWLIELTRAMAREVDLQAPQGAVARPQAWWVDG